MTLQEVGRTLANHGIGYKRVPYGDIEAIYIQHGAFGRPAGLMIDKDEFRPDFRITVDDDGRIYTRVCGYVGYMSTKEVLETIRKW